MSNCMGKKKYEKGGEVDLDQLPPKMKKKTRTGLFSHSSDVRETRKPKTKEERVGRTPDEKIRFKADEADRKKFEKKVQGKMGSFKDGGPVYRDPPMEPVTGEEEKSAFMDEMLFEDRRLKDKESREEYKKTARRGDQEPVEKYAMGGSVCAGTRSAIRGKKFSGTF